MPEDIFIGIDLGGTNLRVYEMFPKKIGEQVLGRNLLGEKDVKMIGVNSNQALTDIVNNSLVNNFQDRHLRIGISAAGDVDEERLVIKKSANLAGIKGEVFLGKDLSESGHDVVMGNDMRCAAAGAYEYGQGKGVNNFMIVTYSSGFNGAKVEKGKIVTRAELGHMPYQPRIELPKWARNLVCGCEGVGHLEGRVSGNGAALMERNYYQEIFSKDNYLLQIALEKNNSKTLERLKFKDLKEDETLKKRVLLTLDARDIYEAYRQKPNEDPQKTIAAIQTQAIADSWGIMVSSYNPLDLIICMGSQTKDWQETFAKAIDIYQKKPSDYHLSTLNKPKIVRNSIRKLGCVGALAYYINVREMVI